MNRTLATALLVGTSLLVAANPAAALSCMEPEPFDMEAAIETADAAAIGTITSIWADTDVEGADARLVLAIEVSEVFKGTVSSRLTLDRHASIWGPYYEEGSEVALLITDGVVTDGQNSLCGPFFFPDDMRQAGGQPISPQPEQPRWDMLDVLRSLVDLVSHLFGG